MMETIANKHEEVQALIRKIIPHYEGSSGSLEVYGSDVLAVFMAGRASLGKAGQLPERKPKGWQCEQGIYPADGFNACLDLMTPIVLEQRLLMRNAQKVIEQFMPNAGSCFGIDFGLLNDTLFALAKATRPTPQDSPAGAVNVGAHRDNDGLDSFRQPKE